MGKNPGQFVFSQQRQPSERTNDFDQAGSAYTAKEQASQLMGEEVWSKVLDGILWTEHNLAYLQ